MARPAKYNWKAIEKAYSEGVEVKEICKYYNITKKTLQNKIYEKKWIITGNIESDINEFKAVLGKVTEKAQNNPETKEIYIDKIVTVLEDNNLISNNRKLLKAVQGIIGAEITKKNVNAKNIKNITGAIRDIESIANPQASKLEINNNNMVQNNTTKSINEFYES